MGRWEGKRAAESPTWSFRLKETCIARRQSGAFYIRNKNLEQLLQVFVV
ncbi:hypothetical protein C2W64_01478 [Brevibacillus laterosporus]|nr:hypothetical protein C2W64_01478 [Brevibacillus laterosporus]